MLPLWYVLLKPESSECVRNSPKLIGSANFKDLHFGKSMPGIPQNVDALQMLCRCSADGLQMLFQNADWPCRCSADALQMLRGCFPKIVFLVEKGRIIQISVPLELACCS